MLDMAPGGRALRLIDSTVRDVFTMGSEAVGLEAEDAALDCRGEFRFDDGLTVLAWLALPTPERTADVAGRAVADTGADTTRSKMALSTHLSTKQVLTRMLLVPSVLKTRGTLRLVVAGELGSMARDAVNSE
jgi:hypothetical protein